MYSAALLYNVGVQVLFKLFAQIGINGKELFWQWHEAKEHF